MKFGCLIIIIAVMLFLTFISIKQGYNTIFHDNWDDNYNTQKAIVTSVYKDSSSVKSHGIYQWTYSFEPIVQYNFNNESRLDTLVWFRSLEEPKFYPGDSLDILISKIDGKLSEAVDQDRIATGIINLFQGMFFLFIGFIAFHYLKKSNQLKST